MGNNKISPSDQEALNHAEELANKIKILFAYLDNLFIEEDHCEDFLLLTKKSLEDKILHSETALPVLLSMGCDYDSTVDRAKVNELTALLDLIKARKNLRVAVENERKRKVDKTDMLRQLGLL